MLSSRIVIRPLVWAISLGSIAAFLALGFRRLFYPLELDYIEGVMMDHVVRLAQGKPMYVEPSLEFITLAYMPGFATVTSLLARVFGPALWEPRLVSLTAMSLNAVLVAWILWKETRDRTLAVAGSGLLLAAYGVTGGHFDVGRPDSLMLFLSLSGLMTLRFTTRVRGAVIAALLLTLAFFTKQHAVWFVIAALVHLLLNDRMRFWPFALVVVAGCAGGFALLTAWLGPWFPFFTWEIPSHWSQIDKVRILNYLGKGLFGTLGILSGGALLGLALPDQPHRGPSALWWWAGLGAFATGMMATLDPDAFRHVLNPTVVMLAVLGPLSLWLVVNHVGAWPGASREARSAIVYVLLFVQFLPLAYSLRDQLPHARGQEAWQTLQTRIRSYPGPVMMFYHGFYGWQAGKGTWFHQISLDDIVRARGNRLLREDPGFIDRLVAPLIDGPNRPVIITDIDLEFSGSESQPWWSKVAPHYRRVEDLGWISAALNPVNGNHWTPQYVYVPK